jgi:hypothetical protein
MHIDILQVHDSSTADSEFSCKDECNSLPNTIPIASDLTPDLLQGDLQTPPSTTTSAPSSSSTNNHRDDLLWWRDSINLDKANLTLMGFSKGCVVLNQVRKMNLKLFITPFDRLTIIFLSSLVYL